MNFWGFVWSSETVEDKAEAPVEVEAENIAVAFLGFQGVCKWLVMAMALLKYCIPKWVHYFVY